MTYTGPVFTSGPAQKRDDRVVLGMLKMMRDSERKEWRPGELGNRFGFTNLGTAQWRGYIEEIRPGGRDGGYTCLVLTSAGEQYLRQHETE